jgi:hypothetical protein
MSMRVRVLVGVVVATAVSTGVALALLRQNAAEASFVVVAVNVALAFVSSLIIWWGMRARTKSSVRIAEFLRAISIGRQDSRLDPAKFGDLEDVARAANEIAAAVSEREDPAVGAVKSKKRDTPIEVPTPEPVRIGPVPVFPLRAPSTTDGAADVQSRVGKKRGVGADSEHPEIGTVRVIQRRHSKENMPAIAVSPEPESAPTTTADAQVEAPAEPREAEAVRAPGDAAASRAPNDDGRGGIDVSAPVVDATADAKDRAGDPREGQGDVGAVESSSHSKIEVLPAREVDSAPHPIPSSDAAKTDVGRVERAARENEPSIDEEHTSSLLERHDTNDTTIDEAAVAATIPTTAADDERVRLRELFDEYILTKKAHDESVADLEFDAFATALSDERRKLIDAHRCRDVRFEIKVQAGEVSLLPRLIR